MVNRRPSEPRWPALMAAMGVGILYYVIPEQLTVAPGWLLFVLTAGLFAASFFFYRTSSVKLNEGFSHAGMAVITLALVASLSLLIVRLPSHKDRPVELLRAAAALWMSNILVFRIVVLAPRCRGTEQAGQARHTCRWGVSVSADVDGSKPETTDRRRVLESGFRGLSVPRV